MVHLGRHLNVVNLLGAVTKNIVKRKLQFIDFNNKKPNVHNVPLSSTGDVMVIVQYCRFGNIQDFLLKHRPNFVDQIVRNTDTIDTIIMTSDYVNNR
jgi:FMS-like tyrosine kinase 1